MTNDLRVTGTDRKSNPRIAVIGLGYVGLPLAVALAKTYSVVGFDIDVTRVSELRRGMDRTREIDNASLMNSSLELTSDPDRLTLQDVFIVTVPTPVDEKNRPDLRAVQKASETVGRAIEKGGIAVFESTVFPGVTEDICGPIIEELSGLTCGEDFHLGYSPERINPGDKVHTVDRITKVVAAQTPETAALLAEIYGSMNDNNIFIARDIKTAEASKVIENAQRDINIAFVNEIALIFGEMGLSVHDVLDAAQTKWNFLGFTPGLVGGHCIGVDPYYLAHAAQEIGYNPEIILSGRRVNDAMGATIAARIDLELGRKSARILLLGITFKENVPDIRNSKVIDIARSLRSLGHQITIHDPLADADEVQHEYGYPLTKELEGSFDCVIGAVSHDGFSDLALQDLVNEDGLIADIKGIWRDKPRLENRRYWSL